MFGHNKASLEQIMNRFNQDSEGLKARKEEEKKSQDEFAAKFEETKKEIIWPAFVDIGNQLNGYGHDYHISEAQEYVDATAHFTPSSITLNIYPAVVDKAFYKPDCTPYVSFIANRYAKKVGITVSTMMPEDGGAIGSHGEFELEQITGEFVEQEVVKVLQNTLIFHKEG
ncbi:MAG: hypothetical protein WC107_04165 [Patescibacteria group bacterium]